LSPLKILIATELFGLSTILSPFSKRLPTKATDRPSTVYAVPAPEIILEVVPSA